VHAGWPPTHTDAVGYFVQKSAGAGGLAQPAAGINTASASSLALKVDKRPPREKYGRNECGEMDTLTREKRKSGAQPSAILM
jgi:hypothetical protein